jgi:hypothetical protein
MSTRKKNILTVSISVAIVAIFLFAVFFVVPLFVDSDTSAENEIIPRISGGSSAPIEKGGKTIGGIPDGSKVTVIGDSITEGSKIDIEEKLPGVRVYAQRNKTVAASLAAGQGGDSGLRIARDLNSTGSLRKYVVFALGTNSGITEEQIDDLEGIVGPERKLILVNYYITPDMSAKRQIFDTYNRALFISQFKYKNIIIADWNAAVAESPETYIANDGFHVHPKHPAGRTLFAQTIYDTLREIWEG